MTRMKQPEKMQGKQVSPDPDAGRAKLTHNLAPELAILAQHSWLGSLAPLTKTS